LGKNAEEISNSLGGITRIQKFLFLLENELGLKPSGDGFEFKAYKAGPYTPKIYDDLEFLENLGLVKSEVSGLATEAEASELSDIEFDELMGDEAPDESKETDYEERLYCLTDDGKEKVEALLKDKNYEPIVEGIRKIKSKYSNYSLNDLLYYVYTKFPEWTTESEIKDKILKGKNNRGSRN
jgi:uncharacterized protein YwgA